MVNAIKWNSQKNRGILGIRQKNRDRIKRRMIKNTCIQCARNSLGVWPNIPNEF